MKKIVVSVGLVALGASCLHAAEGAALTEPTAKLWNISGTLRGFYDDNINTSPNKAGTNSVDGTESTGFSVSPAFEMKWRRETTSLEFRYEYTFLYYDKQPSGQSEHYDQNHQFTGRLEHDFSPRLRVALAESFVLGQEPDLLRDSEVFETVQRIPGNNIRNSASIVLNAEITPKYGIELGYDNAYFNYDDHGAFVIPGTLPPVIVVQQNGNLFTNATTASGTSDRIEHTLRFDNRWSFSRTTTGVLGYNFQLVDYTGDEPVLVQTNNTVIFSDDRNTMTHRFYLGADHRFRPDASMSFRGGANFTDHYNDPNNPSPDVSPYINLTLSYVYAPQSLLQGGFTYNRNSTDVTSLGDDGEDYTQDADSAVLYATVRHRLFPNLYLNLNAQYQHSILNGGGFNNDTENYYLFGINFDYQINRYFSANAGYSYDYLDSEVDRGFDRNRVYIGITASY